jgi:hypothetical protein
VIEALQWIDVKVERSSVNAINRGATLHIGIPLIKGNGLFDQRSVGLSPNKIVSGKLIQIRFVQKCASPRGTHEYIVEPKCIMTLR